MEMHFTSSDNRPQILIIETQKNGSVSICLGTMVLDNDCGYYEAEFVTNISKEKAREIATALLKASAEGKKEKPHD